jgi:hypothetical protein
MADEDPEQAGGDAAAADAPKRQVYVRCNGRALRTTVDTIITFFESVGKPVAILNK